MLDAVLLTVLVAVPLYFFVFRPVARLVGQAAAAPAYAVFHEVVEAMPDALVMVDAEGRMVLANRQTEKQFGYARKELLGKAVEVLLPERFQQPHIEHRQSYLAAPRARPMGAGLELYARRKDGSEFPVDISLAALETDEGVLTISAIRDITERKRLLLYESLLPVCSVCGKVRDDTGTERGQGRWRSWQEYMVTRSTTSLTHGFCPDCYHEYRRREGLPEKPYPGGRS